MSSKVVGQPIIDYFIGLDLGQAQDYSALAIVQRTSGIKGFTPNGMYLEDMWLPEDEIKYTIPHLERFKLGTSYPKIVKNVAARVASIPVVNQGTVAGGFARRILAVDATGVGRPIVDLLRIADVGDMIIPITIHGGNATTTDDAGYFRVPKRDLVGGLQVLLQKRQLKVAGSLPEAETLYKELQTYRFKISSRAHESFNAREGEHDDLVLAAGVAVWCATRGIDEPTDPDVFEEMAAWTGK